MAKSCTNGKPVCEDMLMFNVRKVTLPSGQVIEVASASHPVNLHFCNQCGSYLRYPVEWSELAYDEWDLLIRCPDCDSYEELVAKHPDVEQFDEVLNKGTDKLVDDLEKLARDNMQEWIGRFINALDHDALLPEDF